MLRTLFVSIGMLSFSFECVLAEDVAGANAPTTEEIAKAAGNLNSESFKEREAAAARLNALGDKLIEETLAAVQQPHEKASAKEIFEQFQLAEKLVADRLNEKMFRPLDADATPAEARQRVQQIRKRIENAARAAVAKKFSSNIMRLWLAGRSGAVRTAMLKKGGNDKSEAAVASATAWIAKQQKANGSWTFMVKMPCPNAATGLSLMALLGAGNTPKTGLHAKAVNRGMTFLVKNMKADGSLDDPKGRMYSHGIATIALVEAYGMTRDQKLKAPAQKAVDFIVSAQDPIGGGWRYMPRTRGDTSVLGWKLAALQTARATGLKVPKKTFEGASKFLDSVSADGGSHYGYISPSSGRPATTAIGLLGRIYLGSKLEEEGLVKGNGWLSTVGPPLENAYALFFAHEFMHRFGGENWEPWNTTVRDSLLKWQVKSGAERGSWNPAAFGKDHGSSMGGRLYVTSLAALNLEVYYRNGAVAPTETK